MNKKCYQLITLTYNHEHCITRHLNSIKFQISGKNVGVTLTIVDDCSTDNNIPIIENWIKHNNYLFIKTEILINKKNLGIKDSYIKCLKEIKYQKVKILAGDDLYINNVFDFLDYCVDKPIVFSPSVYLINKLLLTNIPLNLNLSKDEIISLLVKSKNPFVAPGVYINPDLITDNYISYLTNHPDVFREDLPSWYYFFVIKNEDYVVYNSPVTIYTPGFISKSNMSTTMLLKYEFRLILGSYFKRLNSKSLFQKTKKSSIIKQLKIIDSI